ncbi:MAG: hypothetical protein NC412_14845 [Roseburia sp.]|nr:hypothetical protein [Roseburia sp.]MCM1280020.1 hypothetical protein [Robinsoniella sp.]
MKIETTLTYEQFKERFEQHVMPENSYKYKYRKQIYFLGTLSNEDMLFYLLYLELQWDFFQVYIRMTIS